MFWQSAGGLFKRIAVMETKSKLSSQVTLISLKIATKHLHSGETLFTLDVPQVDRPGYVCISLERSERVSWNDITSTSNGETNKPGKNDLERTFRKSTFTPVSALLPFRLNLPLV